MSLEVIGWSIFAGLATGIGALFIYFKKNYSKTSLDFGLGFSAGIMLVATFLSLLIPGIEEAKILFKTNYSILLPLTGFIIGYIFIIFIHDYVPHEHFFKRRDMFRQHRTSRMMLIVFAIALHNLPEGLAVGVGFGVGEGAHGKGLALAIALQNMPEGLVVAIALLKENYSKGKAFIVALMTGLVEPIMAILGFLTASLSVYSLPIALGFAAGAMLFVICQEILPEVFRQGSERAPTLGVLLGVVLMVLLEQIGGFLF